MQRCPLMTLLLALLALAACGSPPATKTGAASAVRPTPSTAAPVASEAVPPATSPEVPAGRTPGPPPVDLLWVTYARVAVSSHVDNPRDLPDHLVDHDPSTAWNSKTGDLVGAWVSFRVPADARVDYLMLSAGFDKQGAKEDLFFANHRITSVRVFRDDKLVREAPLSPDVRTPQRIDVGTPGGSFKIEVASVTPGAHPGWREVVVSEFAVFGSPGAQLRPKPERPPVQVGSFNEGSFNRFLASSYTAACRKFIDYDVQATDEYIKLLHLEDTPGSAKCGPPATRAPGRGTVVETAHIPLSDAPKGPYRTHFEGKTLALRTAEGVTLTNVRTAGKETAFFWTVTYKLLSEAWQGDALTLDVEHDRVTDSDGCPEPQPREECHSEERLIVRTVCDGRTLTCVSAQRK